MYIEGGNYVIPKLIFSLIKDLPIESFEMRGKKPQIVISKGAKEFYRTTEASFGRALPPVCDVHLDEILIFRNYGFWTYLRQRSVNT